MLNLPEERISGDISIEFLKIGKQRKHTEWEKKKKNIIFKNWDNYKRCNTYNANTRRQRKIERNRRDI